MEQPSLAVLALIAVSTSVQAARPALDRIVLCKADDPDWTGLLDKPYRSDLTLRSHYKGEENEHAFAYPKRVTIVLGARLLSIYSANGEHEDNSSYAVLRGNYTAFITRARTFYGKKPSRVGPYVDGDGPARQDRFTFKSDDLVIGARFAQLPRNKIAVRCRYDG